ncbi:MAG TPA: GNAT family N-acetyltransferase [Actinocrinis sp.]|jgi:predicted GNAT family acetyltransferase|uniref:GNAT family N-acetyltransferase n=1 Tax=Actinocrinis sp. TaxID=1920516 RepID=UPI002D6BD527|nr:GNAT family N-acetyltransferase [Actinocrinis sp.]HZU57083.1 GNAT family N-acetyltransferase [Actinocrinis sp.]
MSADMSIEIRDERDEGHYSAYLNGQRIGYATWVKVHDTVVLPHAEVVPAWERQGIGSMLARRAFEDAKADGLTVLPLCPFMKRWAELHPAFRDIVRTPRPGEMPAVNDAVHAVRTLESLADAAGPGQAQHSAPQH